MSGSSQFLLPPDDGAVVTRSLLDRRAAESPGSVFVRFGDDGEEWSFAQLHAFVRQTAVGLQNLGIRQGDHVAVWLPNCRENLRLAFAINYIGAVCIPINIAYRGQILAHVLRNSRAKLLIGEAALLARLSQIETPQGMRLVAVRQDAPVPDAARYEDVLLPSGGTLRTLERPIRAWDPLAVIYTSGTTGASKGVICTYLQLFSAFGPEAWPLVGADDRFMLNMPLFHVGGYGIAYSMLARGASIAFMERFETDRFWTAVRETGTTVTVLLGVMASFLLKNPPSPDDRKHALKLVYLVPHEKDAPAFAQRFGVDVYTFYNMTEVSTPLISSANPGKPALCGRVRSGVEVRIVDRDDWPVPVGAVGELVVRTEAPWAICAGYLGDADATAQAWRNGWFHTGDAFRCDETGNYYFVDRLKDAIRRRGENISSAEVEAELLSHPAIREAAAVAVPSETSEDDVLACIVPADGAAIDLPQLIDYLRARMPHYMVPRYIRVMRSMPKTPTNKIRKADLRAEGLTEDCWDREKAGIRIKSERLPPAPRQPVKR